MYVLYVVCTYIYIHTYIYIYIYIYKYRHPHPHTHTHTHTYIHTHTCRSELHASTAAYSHNASNTYKLPTEEKEHHTKAPTSFLRDATNGLESINRLSSKKSPLKAKSQVRVCEDTRGSLSSSAAYSKAVGKSQFRGTRARIDTEESEEEFISFLAGFEREIAQLTKRNLGAEYPR
jgi:hypothetical protein